MNPRIRRVDNHVYVGKKRYRLVRFNDKKPNPLMRAAYKAIKYFVLLTELVLERNPSILYDEVHAVGTKIVAHRSRRRMAIPVKRGSLTVVLRA